MEPETQFLIPYGMDQEGNLVRRPDASREQRYRCPHCGEPLIVRTGDLRAKHFAHLGAVPCSPAAVLHAVAKRLLVKTVHTWRSGKGPAPRIERECTRCHRPHWQPLPDKVLGASLAHRLPSGRIVDVALLGENEPVAALEVSVPHLVQQEKSDNVEVPWIALNGDEVIGNPLLWKPRTDRFNPYTCGKCKSQSRRRERALEHRARQLPIPLPWGNYHAEPARCYRCQRALVVFTWPGHAMWTVKRPPEPIPPTVKFAYTRTTGTRYWANTCPHCHAVQGDWNLYAEPGGPFFEVGQYEDDVENKEEGSV